MKIHLQIGWGCQFVMNEKQLAQLMPLLEQVHYVEDHYVEGMGRVFSYKKFEPSLATVVTDRIYTEEEIAELKVYADGAKTS